MLGLFGTLNLAARSLQAQMTGVEISGQNLANVNTAGYTRQRVDIQTSPAISTNIGPEGTGANAVAIQQIANSLLNHQIQSQASVTGYWNANQSALQSAQNALGEFLNGTGSTSSTDSTTSVSSSGLANQLNGLFSAFQSLSASPTSATAQQAVVNQAQNAANTFNQIDTQISHSTASLNTSVSHDVNSANKLLSDIANLNSEITYAEFTGGSANSLLDARNQDLENLSQLVNIQTSTGTGNSVNISIGGQTLVAGTQVMDTLQTYDSGGGRLLVQTATGGVPLTLTGGSIQGAIDARDGALATMQNSLNTLAATLITQVNNLHASGYSSTGTTGANFFNGAGSGTITVNPSLVSNPGLIQTSGSATASSDNAVILKMAQLASTAQASLKNQTMGVAYDQSVADLGDALQTANNQASSQAIVATMFKTQRDSVSGVNVDEEMTNLMGFQRAYQASAKLVSTVDSMIQTVLSMKN